MKTFKPILKNEKGFTLVEILVVIAIIAILFVTLLPQIDNAVNRSRETGVKTDFHTFQTAAESYLRQVSGKGLSVDTFNTFLDKGMEVTAATSTSAKADPWKQQYAVNIYEDGANGAVIVVKSNGPDESPTESATDDNLMFASYYYQGQVTSCTSGFDTNNIQPALMAVDGKAKCGKYLGNGTTLVASAIKKN